MALRNRSTASVSVPSISPRAIRSAIESCAR